eukprot:400371_1
MYVRAASGALSDEFIQSFGAVVVIQTLPQKEINRINNLCRTRQAVFILAVTHGITAHFFSDFASWYHSRQHLSNQHILHHVYICHGVLRAAPHGHNNAHKHCIHT